MDMRESIAATVMSLSFLWFARAAAQDVFPGPTRSIERLLLRVLSSIWEVVWVAPAHGMVARRTVWAYLIFLVASTVVGAAVALGDGETLKAILYFVSCVVAWGVPVGFWYLVRFIARRRYTPRPLPTRRRER